MKDKSLTRMGATAVLLNDRTVRRRIHSQTLATMARDDLMTTRDYLELKDLITLVVARPLQYVRCIRLRGRPNIETKL